MKAAMKQQNTTTPANDEDVYTAHRTVRERDAGQRLDQYIVSLCLGTSRAHIQRGILNGAVRVNGQPARPAARLKTGDTVEVNLSLPGEKIARPTPEPIQLDVLYEDPCLLVLNKQPGLVIHPTENTGRDTLVHALLHYDSQTFEPLLDNGYRPGIVHRLDKDTSGILVVGKTLDMTARLKEAFKARAVDKTYVALVKGHVHDEYGEIRTLIGRHPGNRRKMAVVEEDGKEAFTRYRVLERESGASLLEIRIHTGRTHEIRIHMAHLGHPVIGDELYGGKRPRQPGCDIRRHMLHHWKLAFPHPETGITREYIAPLPKDILETLTAFGFQTFQPERRD